MGNPDTIIGTTETRKNATETGLSHTEVKRWSSKGI
jgi:hypothetical protein